MEGAANLIPQFARRLIPATSGYDRKHGSGTQMIHNSTSHNPMGDHYAASVAINPAPYPSSVLAQLQEDGNQARVMLTP